MTPMARPESWDDLCEFPTDDDIGAVVLGPERKKEFHGLATLREIDGMPKIDTFWGGRPKLLVRKFIESDQRIAAVSPARGRGERGKWNETNSRRVPA
jgi:hypothetical protein